MPDFNTMQRRRLAARKQAMPDGSFPIRNVSDLKNAIQAYGRAKNKEAAKAWIKRRAKALGREDLLPDSWRTDTIVHYGIKGQKWGIRRYQNKDGTLTTKGRQRNKNGQKISKSKSNRDELASKINKGKQATQKFLNKYGSTIAKGAAITALAAIGVPYSALLVKGIAELALNKDFGNLPGITSSRTREVVYSKFGDNERGDIRFALDDDD